MTQKLIDLKLDGQIDFTGGMQMFSIPPETGYAWGRNIEVRGGYAATRRAVGRVYPNDPDGNVGVMFTPLEFDNLSFLYKIFSGTIQGVARIKAPDWSESRLIVCSGGTVYTLDDNGSVYPIDVITNIATTETVVFVQSQSGVQMFRGSNNATLWWDFSNVGFVEPPSPIDTYNSTPSARGAVFMFGRVWAWLNNDDLASTLIDEPHSWILGEGVFSVNYGDGHAITAVIPFNEDMLIVSKDNAVYGLTGVNGADTTGIICINVCTTHGVIGKNAYVVVGDDLWYLSYGGIYTVSRNQYNKMQGTDLSVSSEISPIMGRVNWKYASGACASNWDNYVLFAVPLDGSTVNNAVLVYDLLLQKWVSVWDSHVLRPVSMYKEDGVMYYIGSDFTIRHMYSTNPYDSSTPYLDVKEFSNSAEYNVGDLVKSAGSYYKCIRRTPVWQDGNPPTQWFMPVSSADFWMLVSNPVDEFGIVVELLTRPYNFGIIEGEKVPLSTIVGYSHQDPCVTLELRGEDPYVVGPYTIGPVSYGGLTYEVMDLGSWDPSNDNGDQLAPHRNDYTLYIPSNGMWMDNVNGVVMNIWERHTALFINSIKDTGRSVKLKITNTKGLIRIHDIMVSGKIMKGVGMFNR